MSFDKTDEFLEAAVYCLERGHPNASTSRSYYAMFQAARIALEAFGIGKDNNWTHEGLQSAFARDLIHRRKIMPAHLAKSLSEVMGLRLKADYNPKTISTREAKRALEAATEFVTVIKEKVA